MSVYRFFIRVLDRWRNGNFIQIFEVFREIVDEHGFTVAMIVTLRSVVSFRMSPTEAVANLLPR